MKSGELRELTRQELETKLKDQEERLLRIRFEKQSGQMKNPLLMRNIRREIARIKTILREKRT